MNYVFDSSAVLRYLDREAGWERVRSILIGHEVNDTAFYTSAAQWGEIAGNVRRREAGADVQRVLVELRILGIEPTPVSPEQAVRAAMLRIDFGLRYADAMLAALALELDQAVLLTADFDFKAVEQLLRIEFLPGKPVVQTP